MLGVYRALGGVLDSPKLRPGAWDLAFEDDLVVELDEELHFNRYRLLTLDVPWYSDQAWAPEHRELCVDHEGECLSAGKWGQRWTNDSCIAMFGPGSPPGVLDGAGAPRWKQRALYDAMKDLVPLVNGLNVVRSPPTTWSRTCRWAQHWSNAQRWMWLRSPNSSSNDRRDCPTDDGNHAP